jgi:hypothetical protein
MNRGGKPLSIPVFNAKSSNIPLFRKEPLSSHGRYRDKHLVKRYAIPTTSQKRPYALTMIVSYKEANSFGFFLDIENNVLYLKNNIYRENIYWPEALLQQGYEKISLVQYHNQDGVYLLQKANHQKFLQCIQAGEIFVQFRLYVDAEQKTRNSGTMFYIHSHALPNIYDEVQKIQ